MFNEEAYCHRLANTVGKYFHSQKSVRKPAVCLQTTKVTATARHLLPLDRIHRWSQDYENDQQTGGSRVQAADHTFPPTSEADRSIIGGSTSHRSMA